jgi:hypothetical protein
MPHKLGKLRPQFPEGLKTIKEYRTVAPPAPPASVPVPNVNPWGMDGNDVYGDCTLACAAHLIEAWNADTHRSDPVPSAAQVDAAYLKMSPHDTGLVISTVLAKWHKPGLWGDKVWGHAPVQTHDQTEIRLDIAQFGGVYIGVQLPQSAEDQTDARQPWTIVEHSPILGGHAIPLLGYDATYAYAVTWGAVQAIAWSWLNVYMDEAWVVLSQQVVEAGGYDGINLAALEADLRTSARKKPGWLSNLVAEIESDL